MGQAAGCRLLSIPWDPYLICVAVLSCHASQVAIFVCLMCTHQNRETAGTSTIMLCPDNQSLWTCRGGGGGGQVEGGVKVLRFRFSRREASETLSGVWWKRWT